VVAIRPAHASRARGGLVGEQAAERDAEQHDRLAVAGVLRLDQIDDALDPQVVRHLAARDARQAVTRQIRRDRLVAVALRDRRRRCHHAAVRTGAVQHEDLEWCSGHPARRGFDRGGRRGRATPSTPRGGVVVGVQRSASGK
jgi:hypothetical protein